MDKMKEFIIDFLYNIKGWLVYLFAVISSKSKRGIMYHPEFKKWYWCKKRDWYYFHTNYTATCDFDEYFERIKEFYNKYSTQLDRYYNSPWMKKYTIKDGLYIYMLSDIPWSVWRNLGEAVYGLGNADFFFDKE
jgi:hypothetical protein